MVTIGISNANDLVVVVEVVVVPGWVVTDDDNVDVSDDVVII
jgi:hypothetical protein